MWEALLDEVFEEIPQVRRELVEELPLLRVWDPKLPLQTGQHAREALVRHDPTSFASSGMRRVMAKKKSRHCSRSSAW